MLLMYGQCDFREDSKDTILAHVINLVQRRNRQERTQNFRKQ
jgi:hypothetical protein